MHAAYTRSTFTPRLCDIQDSPSFEAYTRRKRVLKKNSITTYYNFLNSKAHCNTKIVLYYGALTKKEYKSFAIPRG